MKAVAVIPGQAHSIHLRDVPEPTLDAHDGHGVLVDVIRVGVDGTDLEINEAKYGEAPPGDDYLIIGHESLGRVREGDPLVGSGLQPGTLVVATVRRPGSSPYDDAGMQDFTTDDVVYERGISRRHGFLCERFAEHEQYLIPIPPQLEHVGVLLEPLSISEKGIAQAYEIQRRLKFWRPQRACVLGAGSIGMLAALALRLRGLDVTVFSKRRPPHLKSGLVEQLGATYVSSEALSLADASTQHGPFDIMFEATGYSPLAFEAADVLAKNGVLILSSVTGGDRIEPVPTDRINQGFVLGNKVMVGTVNSSPSDFRTGVDDLIRAETLYPGWLSSLLTTPIPGLDRYEKIIEHLTGHPDAIKVFVEVTPASRMS